jgi:hypothetical protein
MAFNIIKYGDCLQSRAWIQRDHRGIFQLCSGVQNVYSIENLSRDIEEARQNLTKRIIPFPDDVLKALSDDITENMEMLENKALHIDDSMLSPAEMLRKQRRF